MDTQGPGRVQPVRRGAADLALGFLLAVGLLLPACSGGSSHPACGSQKYSWKALVPGPAEPGYDAGLEHLAREYDRGFHAIHAYPTGLNEEVVVPLDRAEERALLERFLREDDGWDLAAFAGKNVEEVVGGWQPVAGAYAGVGVAADAFRYGVLRDQGYACAEVDRARTLLLRSLEGLHRALLLTGTPGVVARGYIRTDLPGDGQTVQTTPLFDDQGNPLPVDKNNGTWRADNSGQLPNYVWIDSCSRDMYIGWAIGFAGAWEVVRDDPTFSVAVKQTLQTDALSLVRGLPKVRSSGYDLEIPDADGRTTYHGYLNENNVDRVYIDGARDGFYSLMALGCVSALNYVADDPEISGYLVDRLIRARDLPGICKDNLMMVDMGVGSNYSNYNMSFDGAWLALRYIQDAAARQDLTDSLQNQLYAVPGHEHQPAELGQSFFDFAYAAGMVGGSAFAPPVQPPDQGAIDRGVETLKEFPEPPYWEIQRTNCDDAEIASGVCIGDDGTQLDLLGYQGRGGTLVAKQVVPMRIRPPSNFHWRSNPYEPNGGSDGTRIDPGVDFRFAYWLGRWVKR